MRAAACCRLNPSIPSLRFRDGRAVIDADRDRLHRVRAPSPSPVYLNQARFSYTKAITSRGNDQRDQRLGRHTSWVITKKLILMLTCGVL